jgi:hypothetical protein
MPTPQLDHKKYTRQQLKNWMLFGNVDVTTGTVDKKAMATRIVDFAIQHNPTAVYQKLKADYGKDFPNWTPGAEYNPGSWDTMSKFLGRKLAALSANDAIAFATPYSELPSNPRIKNWTNPID